MRAGFHRSGLLLSDDRTAVVSFIPAADAESVDIPDSVTDIPASLFSGCASLKRIKLSSALRSLPDRLFEGCSSLEKIVMPPEIDSIGRAAFSGCASLKSIPFRAGLAELSEDVFSYCTSLASLVIPDTVERIKSGAAADCTKLAAVVLPASLKTLEAGAFAGCSSLRHIRISEDNDVFYVDEKDGCLYRREKDDTSVIVLRPCDFERTAAKLIKSAEDETPSDELEKEDVSEIDRYEADARKAAIEAEVRESERTDEASGTEKTDDTTAAASDFADGQGDDAEESTDHALAEDSGSDLDEEQADEGVGEQTGGSDAKEPVATLSKKNDNSDAAENRRNDIAENAAAISVEEAETSAENLRNEMPEAAADASDAGEAVEESVDASDTDEGESREPTEPERKSGEEREERIIDSDGEVLPDEIEICKFNNRESSDVMEKRTMANINQASVDEIFKKASEIKSENTETTDDGFKPISQDELNMLVAESDILQQNTPADLTASASAQEHEYAHSDDSLLKRIADAAKKYECIDLSNTDEKNGWNDGLYVFAEGLVLDSSGSGHFSKALENCARRIAAIRKYSKIFLYYGLPFGDDEFAHLFTSFIAERNTVYACSASKMSLLSEDARCFASLAGISLERDQVGQANARAGDPETKILKLMLQDDYSA